MDYNRITSQEGYRIEDLNEKNQEIMNYLYMVLINLNEADVESIDCFGEEMIDDESILGKALKEIKDKFKKNVELWMHSEIMGIQISLAESEGK